MAKRILVPLDQSLVAETVIPLVADAARGGGGSVRLLHVAPVPGPRVTTEGRVLAYADQETKRLEAEGLDYLRTVELHLDGVPVESVVRFGEPVAEILREAEAFGADLIAVTTTGRSGLRRVALGSVAEQVFRKAEVAVMLYHAGRAATR
jgi:nucleotide-binding universal stress UspA family protein